MLYHDFIQHLHEQLQKPLPGYDAQVKMMPPSRLKSRLEPTESTRKSAVLIVFYPVENHIFFPIIRRPSYEGVHGGQMALPGGQMDKGDGTLIQTALREAKEEVGIVMEEVKILGKLTEIFIPPSNFTCLPIVGYLDKKPHFIPDSREVDTIFEINIEELKDKNAVSIQKVRANHLQFETPCFLIQNQVIWGATAIMLAELLEMIQK